jgi:hypothetical protein
MVNVPWVFNTLWYVVKVWVEPRLVILSDGDAVVRVVGVDDDGDDAAAAVIGSVLYSSTLLQYTMLFTA